MSRMLIFFKKTEILLLAAALSLMALWGFFPVAAEAAVPPRPLYLGELQEYRRSFEQYKILQEKQDREETLAQALIRHQIRSGETLSSIANAYGTSVAALAHWNNIANPHFIRAGQYLDIITVEGSLHHVRKGDTLERIALEYRADPAVIASFNLLDERRMFAGQKLVIPGGAHPQGKEAVAVTLLASRADRHMPEAASFIPLFAWPVKGAITSYYGMRNGLFHFGLDIGAPYGAKIGAAAGGIVEYCGIKTGYGRLLIIDHGRGWRTLYAHNAQNLVSVGDYVSTGQSIAKVGASGNATGPHVHLEIIFEDRKLDPLLFLP